MMMEMVTKRSFTAVAADDEEDDNFIDEAPMNRKLPTTAANSSSSSTTNSKVVMVILSISFLMVLTSFVTLQVEYQINHDGSGTTTQRRRWVPTLLTDIEVYPGYQGTFVPRGRITIRFEDDESEFLLRYELEGLGRNSQNCRIVIHEGTSCEEPLGLPYYNTSMYDNDAWNVPHNVYSSNDQGYANNAFVMSDIGIGSRSMKGHVAVVYDCSSSDVPGNNNGIPIGCGILKNTFNINAMEASMQLYAGYENNNIPGKKNKINPSGTVKIMAFEDNVLRIRGSLDGLEPNCNSCGIHIHEGYSCGFEDDEKLEGEDDLFMPDEVVGMHWFVKVVDDGADDNNNMIDPWTAQKATYTSDAKGHADFSFYIYNGYDFEDNIDHALVVHGQDNTRIGCGMLKPREI